LMPPLPGVKNRRHCSVAISRRRWRWPCMREMTNV
jgi:hypothetical protein